MIKSVEINGNPKGYHNGFSFVPTGTNPTGVKEFSSDSEFKEMLAEAMADLQKGEKR